MERGQEPSCAPSMASLPRRSRRWRMLVGIPDGAEVSFRLSHVQTLVRGDHAGARHALLHPAVRAIAKWGRVGRRRTSAVRGIPRKRTATSQVVFDPGRSKAEAALSRSLVSVECRSVPRRRNGVPFFRGDRCGGRCRGGAVVVDRNTVPTTRGRASGLATSHRSPHKSFMSAQSTILP